MFLNALKDDTKELFLQLCVNGSLSNKTFEEEEKETIFDYCREMGLKEHLPDSPEDIDSFIAELSSKTNYVEKKIIVLGILELLKSDGECDGHEKEFIDKVVSGLHVREQVVQELSEQLEIYSSAYKSIALILCE